MRFIRGLSPDTIRILERIYQQSKYHQVRLRSQCIQLSNKGYKIIELIKIFKISRSTIYNYFNGWEDQGLVSLYDKKGRGRKSKLNNEQKEIIKEWVKENPKNLDKVSSRILSEWGIKISSLFNSEDFTFFEHELA